MFAKLEFVQNSPLNDVLQDIVDVICGETDPANLSVSNTAANSYILTDLSTSPWEVWDDVAGGHKVIRTLQADSGEYKYIGLHHNSGPLTSPKYGISIMTDWDEVLHTGSNVYGPEYTFLDITQRQQVDSFWYYIYADEFMIYITPVADYGIIGSSGGSNPHGHGLFHGEVTREHPQMKVGDMPNWFISSTTIFGGVTNEQQRPLFFPIGRNEFGNDVSPWRVHGGIPARGQQNWSTLKYNPITIGSIKSPENLGDPTQYPIEPCVTGSSYHYNTYVDCYGYAGNVSERCNIWALPEGSVEIFKFIIFKGITYICLRSGIDTSSSNDDLGFKVIVPYG